MFKWPSRLGLTVLLVFVAMLFSARNFLDNTPSKDNFFVIMVASWIGMSFGMMLIDAWDEIPFIRKIEQMGSELIYGCVGAMVTNILVFGYSLFYEIAHDPWSRDPSLISETHSPDFTFRTYTLFVALAAIWFVLGMIIRFFWLPGKTNNKINPV